MAASMDYTGSRTCELLSLWLHPGLSLRDVQFLRLREMWSRRFGVTRSSYPGVSMTGGNREQDPCLSRAGTSRSSSPSNLFGSLTASCPSSTNPSHPSGSSFSSATRSDSNPSSPSNHHADPSPVGCSTSNHSSANPVSCLRRGTNSRTR